jgi:putative oxidoreductase
MNPGLLVLRVVLGLLVAAHGTQKLTHHLDGDGLAGSIKEFADDGFRGGLLTALVAGSTQVGAGLLMLAGLLTPIASAGIIGVMLVAAGVKLGHGPWAQHDGYEYPLLLAILAGVVAWTGPGAWSLDKVVGLTPWPVAVSAVVTGVGVVSAFGTRLVLHRSAARTPQPVTAK